MMMDRPGDSAWKRNRWVTPAGTAGVTSMTSRKRTEVEEILGGLAYSPGPIVCSVSSSVWPTLSDKVRLGIPFAPRTSFEHAASPVAALKR